MKLLFVGDVHATVGDLDDCSNLFSGVIQVAKENKAVVVLLGDQYHNHSLLRLEVIDFWRGIFKRFTEEGISCIALVGNHDRSNDSSVYATSMDLHENPLLRIIDKPVTIENVSFISWCKDPNDFVASALMLKGDILVCHQTFDGAQYENGFYAKDGINPARVPQSLIISGHIHKKHQFGKVVYPGTPRWRTVSDANEEKGLLLFDTDNMESKILDTSKWCKKIFLFEATEQNQDETVAKVKEALAAGHDVTLDVSGKKAWISAFLEANAETGKCRVRTFPEKETEVKVKEAEGPLKALDRYLEEFVADHRVTKESLRNRLSSVFSFLGNGQ